MASTDRWEPKLRVKASNMGGSGYRIPTRLGADGKPSLVPGVTTVNNAINIPGLVQWSVDQTAAYCVTHIDDLLSRTEEQGFGFARYYHSRKVNMDDPETDPYNAYKGVLNDLAELGSQTHDWISDFVTGGFPEDIGNLREEQVEMVLAFQDWWDEHDVEVIETEVSLVGNGYAGTIDHFWIVDGVPMLVDAKTSRKVRETHFAQLAALGAAESLMREVSADHEGAVEYDTKKWGKTYWVEDTIPAYNTYAVLHLRPTTEDGPAFCALRVIEQGAIDAGFTMFEGALKIKEAQQAMKKGGCLND